MLFKLALTFLWEKELEGTLPTPRIKFILPLSYLKLFHITLAKWSRLAFKYDSCLTSHPILTHTPHSNCTQLLDIPLKKKMTVLFHPFMP